MSEPKYSSLEEYYDDITRRTIEECTLCGECVRNCPVFPHTEIKDKDPKEIMEKVIDFLKDGAFSDEAFYKAFSCATCGICSESCPQGIDVLLAFEAARIRLAKLGKLPEAFSSLRERAGFSRVLYALQAKPSEAKWLRNVPPHPERTENVVFTGCKLLGFPQIIFAFTDILERLGVNFVTLSGGELCCGLPSHPTAGKVSESEEKARKLIAGLKAFSPKRVILLCPGCYRQFTEFYPKFLELDFEVQFYAQFFNEHLDKAKFTRPLGKTLIYHESCMTRRAGVNESLRKLIDNIPGLKVVRGQTICCGGTPHLTFPQIAQKMAPIFVKTLAEETMKNGADYLVNVCQICRRTFYPSIKEYSFGLKDIGNLLNASMGGREYEDKLEKYWRCESVEEIIEKSRENFEANGLTEEEVMRMLPIIFLSIERK